LRVAVQPMAARASRGRRPRPWARQDFFRPGRVHRGSRDAESHHTAAHLQCHDHAVLDQHTSYWCVFSNHPYAKLCAGNFFRINGCRDPGYCRKTLQARIEERLIGRVGYLSTAFARLYRVTLSPDEQAHWSVRLHTPSPYILYVAKNSRSLKTEE
jgi:hypothetical protein